jgi:DNA-binding NarL/FixJ family response regulator
MVRDLMTLSRIRAAAPAGIEVYAAEDVQQLMDACREAPPGVVLLDLDGGPPALAALEALRADAATRLVPTLGFFSHVHPERGRQALAAGCARVLPRSLFVKDLAALLAIP